MFDVAAGRFAGRMVAFLHCTENLVLSLGLTTGYPLPLVTDRSSGSRAPAASASPRIQPATRSSTCLSIPSTGQPGLQRAARAMFEHEVPLTKTLAVGHAPAAASTTRHPPSWSASAPGSDADAQPRDVVSIDVQTGSTTVSPESPGVNRAESRQGLDRAEEQR